METRWENLTWQLKKVFKLIYLWHSKLISNFHARFHVLVFRFLYFRGYFAPILFILTVENYNFQQRVYIYFKNIILSVLLIEDTKL